MIFFIFLLRYRLAYQGTIAAMPSKDQWEALDLGFTVGPPHAKRPRGRPKKQRIRGIDEEDGKRKVSYMFFFVRMLQFLNLYVCMLVL